MVAQESQSAMQMVAKILKPWQDSLEDPRGAQKKVLQNLLKVYAHTEYGRKYSAEGVGSIEDYRAKFPVTTYEDYQPVIRRAMAGETELILNEPPIGWAITRGTTKDENKFIPMTPTDLEMRVSAGRAVMMYAAQNRSPEVFSGVNLNLNFPSVVGTMQVGDREVTYGYSSGIYTKFVSQKTPVRSLPSQEDIDALGGSKAWSVWKQRFDLAYEQCQGQNVTLVGGVAPTAIQFGRYLHKKYGCYPKDQWRVLVMTLGSTPGINTYRAETLKALYGRQAANEMQPGETGSLIVSTPVLARYKIGDLIRAYAPPYFRCIGRDRWYTPFVYAWRMLSSLDFGGL